MSHGPLADAAVRYAQQGIRVFPLWWPHNGACACRDADACSRPAKHPRNGDGGLHQATADPDQVAAWWQRWPLANIGMPAGRNGLAFLDVDPRHGGDESLATLTTWCLQRHGVDLMATRVIRTGSGGIHLAFQAPPDGVKSAARTFGAAGIDTRGNGGYVVAPPSVHASGNRYELIDNGHTLAPWPDILTRLTQRRDQPAPPPPGTPQPISRAEKWAAAGLAAECATLAAMTHPTGSRNDALNIAAYKIGRRVGAGLLDEGQAYAALHAACSGWQDKPDTEIRATIASGIRGGMNRPYATTRAEVTS